MTAVGFVLLMAFALQRVVSNRRARASKETVPAPASVASLPATPVSAGDAAGPASGAVAENAAYLDAVKALDGRIRSDRDRQGNAVTRRDNPPTPPDAGRESRNESDDTEIVVRQGRGTTRLQGRLMAKASRPGRPDLPPATDASSVGAARQPTGPSTASRRRPGRFNPYGNVLKCELVFTIDSTNEQTPLVAIVMEPVYNNGQLVIPAGAELHGVARPDRLRDRIFSGPEWVLVFPRERGRANGRQLNVKGVALDRVEPDANGMTWGITDGSYGLEGTIIRTLNDAEIKRFVATFMAAASVGLQERQSDRSGQQITRNSPANAALQGLSANFDRIAQDISDEITQHGVFIRVPAGHQFYFYPMQIIDPDAADISADIATVK